jgi:UPF0755 protein
MKKKNVIAVVLALVFALVIAWWVNLPSKTITITIPENSSAKSIAEVLYNSKAISSKFVFRAVVKLSGRSKGLKAGTYVIAPRSSVFSIARMIISGKGKFERVTIPEGYSSSEIADVLASKGIVNKEKFLKLVEDKELEGYLFPDTYYFDRKLPEQVVADKMLKEFNKIFTPAMQARADALKMSKKKIVTLASIIEKEAVVANERPLIAGVFYNRLKKGWMLESCATIQYALGEHKKRLSYKDTKIDSPYNTYKCYGLPPGPICNPGRDSINAALYPEQTEDMFFVAGSSGTHMFSRYFSEHINNKLKQKRASRKQSKASS